MSFVTNYISNLLWPPEEPTAAELFGKDRGSSPVRGQLRRSASSLDLRDVREQCPRTDRNSQPASLVQHSLVGHVKKARFKDPEEFARYVSDEIPEECNRGRFFEPRVNLTRLYVKVMKAAGTLGDVIDRLGSVFRGQAIAQIPNNDAKLLVATLAKGKGQVADNLATLFRYSDCEMCVQASYVMGDDMHRVNDDGETLLHGAATNNRVKCMNALYELGVDPNQRCNEGRTPLHEAALWGNLAAIEVLAQQGADLNSQDASGLTPLHMAVFNGKIGSIFKLSELGADLSRRSAYRITPSRLAFNRCDFRAFFALQAAKVSRYIPFSPKTIFLGVTVYSFIITAALMFNSMEGAE